MTKRPSMYINWTNYGLDTGHLSAANHGAYLLLTMYYFEHGCLPSDDVKLAKIARAGPKKWLAMRETISKFFTPDWRPNRDYFRRNGPHK